MSNGTYLLAEIVGSAALLLWGIRMARTSVMRAHGLRIRRLLPKALQNRFVSLLTGIGAAAVLQSSTAVAVFAASLAGMGVVPVTGGLALMLGADIGSAVVASLLSLNLKGAWPLLVFVGYILHAIGGKSNSTNKQHGRFALGLGLVMIALTFMGQVSGALASSNVIRTIIASLAGEPILAVLVLCVLTWLAHSSIAMLLFVASLADSAVVTDPQLIVAAVLGINLGGGIPAIILTLNQAPDAKKIVVGNALFRLLGVILAFLFLNRAAAAYTLLPGRDGFSVVTIHILFNLGIAALFIGFLGFFTRVLDRLIPQQNVAGATDDFSPRYIPPIPGAFQAALPVSALTREVLRMGDVVHAMFEHTAELLHSRANDNERVRSTRRLDDKVDALYKAIRGYAIDLTRSDLPEGEAKRVNGLLRHALNLENIGDVIDKSLLDITAQKAKSRRAFSEDGKAELGKMFSYVKQNMEIPADVVMSWRGDLAGELLKRKREFNDMVNQSSERHMDRLRCGVSSSLETSSYHMDIINDLQRINSLVVAVANDVAATQETN